MWHGPEPAVTIVEPQRSAKASPAEELPVEETAHTECGLSLWKQLVQAPPNLPDPIRTKET